jgi:hypothetical protein
MRRAFQVVGLLWLAAAVGFGDQRNPAKELPPRPLAPRPNALKNGGLPKNGGGRKNLGPRLLNPNSSAARLFQASPEERDRVIEKFPAARQEAIRRNLEWFDRLPKPQQELVLKRTERLAELSPQKQRAFQQQLQALQRLPQERKQAVGMALRRLQIMSDDERAKVLASEPFKSRFSAEEQKIIADLSEVMLPPM